MAKKAKKTSKDSQLTALNRNIIRLAKRMESTNLQDYIDLTNRPMRMLWNNFLSGLARGVGMFVGMGAMGALILTVVTVLVVWLLNFLNMFPVVGDVARAIQDVFKEFLNKHK